jgi:flagellar hook-basal body complex protein FliE
MDPLSALKIMTGPAATAALSDPTQVASPMTIPAQELQGLNTDTGTQAVGGASAPGSFSNLLGDFVGEVNDKQNAASDAVAGLMGGKNVSLHQAMISMQEANISFQMMVEVRNKLLDSYQELMRMQV